MGSLIKQVKSNAYALLMPWRPHGAPAYRPPARGAGCYPLLALLNHACIPNIERSVIPVGHRHGHATPVRFNTLPLYQPN